MSAGNLSFGTSPANGGIPGRLPVPVPGSAEVAAACLAMLPDATPARTRDRLARAEGDPRLALARGCSQLGVKPEQWAARVVARRTRAWWVGGDGYPIADDVPGRPAVLLGEGDRPQALTAPRVAVVGTRSASPHGLADAREIGAVLARAGVTVVSGLAIGIDGAAHEGALDVRVDREGGGVGGVTSNGWGGVIGVVATGLDIVYPRRHVTLFDRVRRHGLVVGENAYGTAPEAFRFPVRNRIIAALADAVVVVEATAKGGARITAEHALEFGRPVLAIPGSRRNPAAAGTNALIADGAHPLLEPSDVLLAIGLQDGAMTSRTREAPLEGDEAAVLEACGGEAATADQLAARTALSVDAVASALRTLQRGGRIQQARGWWWPT